MSMIRPSSSLSPERLGYSLVLDGALAHVVDRTVRGVVVDWIDIHWGARHWPASNVADLGIALGAAPLIGDALRNRSREAAHG